MIRLDRAQTDADAPETDADAVQPETERSTALYWSYPIESYPIAERPAERNGRQLARCGRFKAPIMQLNGRAGASRLPLEAN